VHLPDFEAPRILFWEPEDERVRRLVALPGLKYHPVVLGDHSTMDARSIDSVRADEVLAIWRTQGSDGRAPVSKVELAAAAVGLGIVNGAVGGVIDSSADVLRAGLRYVGANGTVSCAMIANPPTYLSVGRRIMIADVAVVPHPTPEQLADIAIASADNWQRITGEIARVAFIAATSKSSQETDDICAVQKALAIVNQLRPDIDVDGELQVDAALVEEVASLKLSGTSNPLGSALVRKWAPFNVFVFPDLVSANATYKMLQHLAGYTMTSLTQNLRRPFCDVSRGCTDDELCAAAEQCVSMSMGPAASPREHATYSHAASARAGHAGKLQQNAARATTHD
jgi:phosphotransacetylase